MTDLEKLKVARNAAREDRRGAIDAYLAANKAYLTALAAQEKENDQ